MGCVSSTLSKEVDTKAKAVHDEIESQIKRDRESRKSVVQMLLLGAGESGKSTVLKQIKILHQGGFSDEERISFKEIIFANTILSAKAILQAMPTLLLPLHPDNEGHREYIMGLPTSIISPTLPKEIYEAITALTKDPGFQQAIVRNNEFQLNDSAPYYFEELPRMSTRDYMPIDQDILRSRVKTTGITEISFSIDPLTYKVFDVGGQRSERRKWIHCFEDLNAVVFMVALSEYDQVLREDSKVSRMAESVALFDSVCNSRWLANSSMILFLNKIDLLADKIDLKPLKLYVKDYSGREGYEAACGYFRKLFVSLNRSPNKPLYTHFTCATDTKQTKFVLAAMHDIITKAHLASVGLL
ncbi:heterotrimeric G protein alpha subunit B [Cantharellus anzutake]|uniref:heterotrimeric G protein alpha subunit B n=1 Tax=Cantharellus anzutake TaxID=1750568 RepID=UPI00190691B3|nr:heterotrimeric G protein alpha subunit B [Cantharellus anzutake]KAF8342832.1 heterotrimeric G protein alpha subunit B [Cantharellus anzutake]